MTNFAAAMVAQSDQPQLNDDQVRHLLDQAANQGGEQFADHPAIMDAVRKVIDEQRDRHEQPAGDSR